MSGLIIINDSNSSVILSYIFCQFADVSSYCTLAGAVVSLLGEIYCKFV